MGTHMEMLQEKFHARVTTLWRQRLFVQAFPRLKALARGEGQRSTNSSVEGDVIMGTNSNAITAKDTSSRPAAAAPLLGLLHLIQGVPSEVLLEELEAVVLTVVHALGTDFVPLQSSALEALEVLLENSLDALSPHLSSVAPLLLKLAQHSQTKATEEGNHSDVPVMPPRSRLAALKCLMHLTRLPYPRLHPFKSEVTRCLRGPLDDPRRAIRQQAVKVRNAWFILG
ncbi:unnamed protein product [Choristocarpus tenellus]